MAGLAFFIIIGTMIFAVVFVAKKAKSWLARIGIVCAAFILVFGDEMYGRHKFKEMCRDAGERIYQTINDVEGLEYSNLSLLGSLPITESGYFYVEGINNGKPIRLSMINDKIVSETVISFKSRYLLDEIEYNISKLYGNFYVNKILILDKNNENILAERIAISYEGGWFSRFIASLVASQSVSKTCGSNLHPATFDTRVLHPKLD